MTEIQGPVNKMFSQLNEPIQYQLPIGSDFININEQIGKEIEIEYSGRIVCKACGHDTPKSYGQGYCYPCFTTVPQTAPCILHPEKCEAHKGIYRDKAFAEANCLQPHYVYLALTAGLKVGVTRESQIPTRWIDQGADKALKLAKTPNRHTAGRLEVALKAHFSDKTSWQKMLKNELNSAVILTDEKEKAISLIPQDFRKYVTFDKKIQTFQYPVKEYPKKISTINLDKEPKYKGKLLGIKGQYLIFGEGKVINIRKYGGYELTFRF